MKTRVSIEGMSCQKCVKHVTELLSGVPGVSAVQVNLEKNEALLEGIAPDEAQLRELLDDAGYDLLAVASLH